MTGQEARHLSGLVLSDVMLTVMRIVLLPSASTMVSETCDRIQQKEVYLYNKLLSPTVTALSTASCTAVGHPPDVC